MRVVSCDASDRERWNAFVAATPGGSFYHLFEWRDVNGESFGHRSHYLAALDGDRIVAVLPIVQLRSRLFGNIACSMPFVNYGGPCTQSEAAESLLLDEARSLVRRERWAYLELRNAHPCGDSLPTSAHKVSMTLPLDPDPEVIWSGFKTGHRQDIRRAAKNGITARCGGAELLDAFYLVLSESWHELGTPFYKKDYFERILNTFPSNTRLCVAFAGSEPAAAAFDGMYGDTVEGMWLGTRAQYRKQMAGYVLYWELVRDACLRGYRTFHLGRSTSESSAEAYKRKWNAQPRSLYWQYMLGPRAEPPQLNVSNPRYQFAIRTWRRLPSPVTRILGPFIARSIP